MVTMEIADSGLEPITEVVQAPDGRRLWLCARPAGTPSLPNVESIPRGPGWGFLSLPYMGFVIAFNLVAGLTHRLVYSGAWVVLARDADRPRSRLTRIFYGTKSEALREYTALLASATNGDYAL